MATDIMHKEGVSWADAPLPRRRHACWAQTTGWVEDFTRVDRCPCGAIRVDKPGKHWNFWSERNSRRKKS